MQKEKLIESQNEKNLLEVQVKQLIKLMQEFRQRERRAIDNIKDMPDRYQQSESFVKNHEIQNQEHAKQNKLLQNQLQNLNQENDAKIKELILKNEDL